MNYNSVSARVEDSFEVPQHQQQPMGSTMGGSGIVRIRPQMIVTSTNRVLPQPINSSLPQHNNNNNHSSNSRRHSNNSNGSIVQHPRALSPTSPLRNKIVYLLNCVTCNRTLCTRAMRAILLADTKIELYSTDIPPSAVHSLPQDSLTSGCHCRVRETVCGGCGNSVGYQVSQPCDTCLGAKNNGHFWMFSADAVQAVERKDPVGNGKPLYWAALQPMAETLPVITSNAAFSFFGCDDYICTAPHR